MKNYWKLVITLCSLIVITSIINLYLLIKYPLEVVVKSVS